MEKKEVAGKKVWIIPAEYKDLAKESADNKTKTASDIALAMAQVSLTDKKYLPIYQARYGQDFVDKMKEVQKNKDTKSGTYISEERQKLIREGYTVAKNGNKQETQFQAAATEMLFREGTMI